MAESDNDMVICPGCVHQFRAIPVNVQEELVLLRAQLAEAQKERDALKMEMLGEAILRSRAEQLVPELQRQRDLATSPALTQAHDEIQELKTSIRLTERRAESAEREAEALKHDIERHVQIAAELATDAERWRDYACHQEHCATCADAVSDCLIGSALQTAANRERANDPER